MHAGSCGLYSFRGDRHLIEVPHMRGIKYETKVCFERDGCLQTMYVDKYTPLIRIVLFFRCWTKNYKSHQPSDRLPSLIFTTGMGGWKTKESSHFDCYFSTCNGFLFWKSCLENMLVSVDTVAN